MPKYGFDNRESENRDRLRSFEAAEQRGLRSDIARERTDIAREKMDFDQQYKLGEAERKAEESAMRAQAANERTSIMEKQLALQAAAAELKTQKQELNIEDTIRATQDKIGFIRATRDLRESDPEFDRKLSDAMVAFPNAEKDEFVQKRLGWLTDQRKGHLERTRSKELEAEARAEALKLNMVPAEVKVGSVTYKGGGGDTERARLDRLSHLEDLRSKASDSDVKLYLDEEIRKFREPPSAPAGAAAPAAEPAPGQPAAATAPAASPAAPAKVASAADFNALPSGAEFIDPQGVKRRKP